MFNLRFRKLEWLILLCVIVGCTSFGILVSQFKVVAQTPDAPIVATMKAAGYGDAIDKEIITVTNTAGGFTAATYTTNVKKAFATLETGQIRFWYNGSTPTTTEGHLLEIGQTLTLNGYSQVSRFKAIRTGGTSGVLMITYMK